MSSAKDGVVGPVSVEEKECGDAWGAIVRWLLETTEDAEACEVGVPEICVTNDRRVGVSSTLSAAAAAAATVSVAEEDTTAFEAGFLRSGTADEVEVGGDGRGCGVGAGDEVKEEGGGRSFAGWGRRVVIVVVIISFGGD